MGHSLCEMQSKGILFLPLGHPWRGDITLIYFPLAPRASAARYPDAFQNLPSWTFSSVASGSVIPSCFFFVVPIFFREQFLGALSPWLSLCIGSWIFRYFQRCFHYFPFLFFATPRCASTISLHGDVLPTAFVSPSEDSSL